MITDEDDSSSIEPGGVNSTRTKAKCQEWYLNSTHHGHPKRPAHPVRKIYSATSATVVNTTTTMEVPSPPFRTCPVVIADELEKRRKRSVKMNNASKMNRNEYQMGRLFVRQKSVSPFRFYLK
eukprot:scaffold430_cov73-Skeletonema_marinoi.AAC.11